MRDNVQPLEKLAIFMDYHNLNPALRELGFRMDLGRLREYLTEGRWLLESFVYIGINPQAPQPDEERARRMRQEGFIVRTKVAKLRDDGRLKCDFDAEMVLDIVDFVQAARPDIVVLATGDGDFIPLALWLRMRGIRVEVAATHENLSEDLRGAANGFIDLGSVVEELGRPYGDGNKQPDQARQRRYEHADGNH